MCIYSPVKLKAVVGEISSNATQTTTQNVLSAIEIIDAVISQSLHKYADRYLSAKAAVSHAEVGVGSVYT